MCGWETRMSLPLSREEMLNTLLQSYSAYFDTERCEEEDWDVPLVARCNFYVHSEKYVLLKKAKLWSADCNEYVYLFSLPELTEERYRECEKFVYEKGMARIHPEPGHMYTYLTAVFLCDSCTPEARKALKRCRLYKSFRFSLYGWMDFHTVLLQAGSDLVDTNRSGRSNAKLMKKIFMKTK